MAADKTLIDHLRGLKLKISPNPVIPSNEAKIRLNLSDYSTLKAEKKEGIKYLKEVAKLERCAVFEEGMDYLSNAAVVFEFIGWISKGISLYNIRAEKGQDAMVDDGLSSLYGTQIENNIDRLAELLTKLSIINSSLDNIERSLMTRNQKKKDKARGKGEGEGEEGKGKGKGRGSEGEGDEKGKTKVEGGGQDQDGERKAGKEENEDGEGKRWKEEGEGDQDGKGGKGGGLDGEGEKVKDSKEKAGEDQDGVGGSSDGRSSSGNDSDHGDFDIPDPFLDLF